MSTSLTPSFRPASSVPVPLADASEMQFQDDSIWRKMRANKSTCLYLVFSVGTLVPFRPSRVGHSASPPKRKLDPARREGSMHDRAMLAHPQPARCSLLGLIFDGRHLFNFPFPIPNFHILHRTSPGTPELTSTHPVQIKYST